MRSSRTALVDELTEYPAFAGCPRADVEALVAASDDFLLPAQWSLVQEGVPADAVYVITDGTARVYERRTAVADVGPGDVVGEMALFSDGQRQATVSSVTRISGLRVDYDQLTSLLASRPCLSDAIRAISQRRLAG